MIFETDVIKMMSFGLKHLLVGRRVFQQPFGIPMVPMGHLLGDLFQYSHKAYFI
jgi:hypothetical protein